MQFLSLGNTKEIQVYETFLDIFSDYKQNLQISYEQFLKFLKRSLYSPELSMGVFHHDRLVGYTLIGIKRMDRRLTSYNAASGLVPDYRKKRKRLILDFMAHLFNDLKLKGVGDNIAEIMQENEPVLKIMKRFGAMVNKKIKCYRKKVSDLVLRERPLSQYTFRDEKDFAFLSGYSYEDTRATWQNSFCSLNTIIHDFSIISVKKNGFIVGFGMINKPGGDIPQFYIHETHRERGVGDSLLARLKRKTSSEFISFINVDENIKSLNCYLEKKKFEVYLRGYEMIKYL